MSRTYFFWDPLSDNILQERDESGTVTAEYTTEPGLYGNVISQNRGGVESQYHFDPQGSTLALTDDSQKVSDTYAYSAFGEVTEHTGSTVNPFQYIGQSGYYRCTEPGSYVVRRRIVQSIAGRWLSVDPLHPAFPISGAYCYAGSQPTILIDPSGLQCGAPCKPGETNTAGHQSLYTAIRVVELKDNVIKVVGDGLGKLKFETTDPLIDISKKHTVEVILDTETYSVECCIDKTTGGVRVLKEDRIVRLDSQKYRSFPVPLKYKLSRDNMNEFAAHVFPVKFWFGFVGITIDSNMKLCLAAIGPNSFGPTDYFTMLEEKERKEKERKGQKTIEAEFNDEWQEWNNEYG